MHRIDADPVPIDLDHFPGEGELAAFIFAARKINDAARFFAAEHAAGVGAVGGDDGAVGQADVGEKALVALHQRAADESSTVKRMHQVYSRRESYFTAYGADFLHSDRNRFVRVDE